LPPGADAGEMYGVADGRPRGDPTMLVIGYTSQVVELALTSIGFGSFAVLLSLSAYALIVSSADIFESTSARLEDLEER
jgi:hypothetical protein